MRNRAIRRHQAITHMKRRLKEHTNQHYDDVRCPCFTDPRARARYKEQPQMCSSWCCGNARRWLRGAERLTLQERVAVERASCATS